MIRKLDIKQGNEGPRNDPYAFTEYIFRLNEVEVRYHKGLDNNIKLTVSGVLVNTMIIGDTNLDNMFEKLTGISVKKFSKYYNVINCPVRCTQCGKKGKFYWSDVYPGESLRVCECGNITASNFNMSEVM